MMSKIQLFALVLITSLFHSCKDAAPELPEGIYAVITTNKGEITAELEYNKTPVTVANFITLAEGTNPYVAADFKGKPFYENLKFHRVIPNFMIQGGDPLGNGSGDAGYKFRDEITDLTHEGPGILSMANSGPGTNSSQFFITHVATPWLDGKHTVFGHVVSGMETVNKIVVDDALISVKIVRVGEAAKKFDAVKVFNDSFKNEAAEREKQQAAALEAKKLYQEKYGREIKAQLEVFAKAKAASKKTPSGLQYIITQKSGGKKPAAGTPILIHYSGFLADGTLFDSSNADVAKKFGVFDPQRAAQNMYSPIPFMAGRKLDLAPGILEGLDFLAFGDKAIFFIPSHLGYGEAGAGNGIIPPNADLIFEIEISERK